MLAINGLEEATDQTNMLKASTLSLETSQIQLLEEALQREENTELKGTPTSLILPTEFSLSIRKQQGDTRALVLKGQSDDDISSPEIARERQVSMSDKTSLVTASADGRTVVLEETFEGKDRRSEFRCMRILGKQPEGVFKGGASKKLTKDELQLDANGRFAGVLENGNLKILDNGKKKFDIEYVDSYQLSRDGKILLVRNQDGETSIYHVNSGDIIVDNMDQYVEKGIDPEEASWRLLGKNLLVQIAEDDDSEEKIGQTAYIIQ